MNNDRVASRAIPRRSALTKLGAIAVGLSAATLHEPQQSLVTQQKSDENFERLLRLASVPSLSLAMVDGEGISTRSLGVRRAGESERVNGDRGARVYERVIRALTGDDHPAFLWA